MKYINRTGITTPIGKIVKLDKDGRGVVLPQLSDTNVLGVVTLVKDGEVEVVSDGVRVVFINGVFKPGDTVYLRKTGQTGALGSCYASTSPGTPYVRVGTSIDGGSTRMTRVQMSIAVVGGAVTSGAQVTKEAVESVLTGEISSHSHAQSGITQQQIEGLI